MFSWNFNLDRLTNDLSVISTIVSICLKVACHTAIKKTSMHLYSHKLLKSWNITSRPENVN